MRWTAENVRDYCTEVCQKANIQFTIPIIIKKTLNGSLGRLVSLQQGIYVRPEHMEFSRALLEASPVEMIKDIIRHECAHYIVAKRTRVVHGHDECFRAVCAEIGCLNNGTRVDINYFVNTRMRYEIICPKCGRIQGYSQMCDTLRNIDKLVCRRCKSKIRYVKNW